MLEVAGVKNHSCFEVNSLRPRGIETKLWLLKQDQKPLKPL